MARRLLNNLRWCDGAILIFALWTLACNLTALSGGSLLRLLLSFLLTSLAIGLCFFWKKKYRSPPNILHSDRQHALSERHPRIQPFLLRGLIVLAVVMTLVAHRPDEDDNRYINWAITVVDDPHLSILTYDTLHSPPTRPIFPPTTKVMSREMLIAAGAYLTGIPPIALSHLLFAPLMAAFVILAYRRLFNELAPQYAVYGVLAVVVFLIANGEIHRSYGNFSFVRLHQGKGILVSVIIPLILTYGLRFAARPTKRNWLLLSAA